MVLFIRYLLIFALTLIAGATYAQEDDFDEDAAIEENLDFEDSANSSEDDFSDFADEDTKPKEKEAAVEEETFDDEFAEDNVEEKLEEPAPTPEPKVAEPEPSVEETPVEELPADEPKIANPEPQAPLDPESNSFADNPDYNLEADLHKIFMNFHSAKTSEEAWSNVVGDRRTENYAIQNGDNLWNISKTFFGDGNYWPKIWSVNAQGITNPHLIAPGNNIRFALGDESGPPVFTVTESDIDNDSGNVTINKIEVEIPPPIKPSVPVIKRLPPSFPVWQDSTRAQDYDQLGIDYGKRKILEVVDQFPLSFYVSEEEPEEIGSVKEMEEGSRIASAYQYIYVQLKVDDIEIGDTVLVISNRGPVITTVRSPTAYTIEVQGEIQLVERVDNATGKNIFRAIVTKLVNPITLGSSIVAGKVEMVKINESGPRSQVVAQIIGGQFFNRRLVYGSEAITYLNRGSDDGLREGDILPIRENRLARNPDSSVTSNLRPIGWLQVVKVSPQLATAVILKSWSDIRTGDVTGAGGINIVNRSQKEESKATDRQAKSLTEEFDSEDDFSVGDSPESQDSSDFGDSGDEESSEESSEDEDSF